MKKIDLVIENGIVLTMDSDNSVIENGFVAIDNQRIIKIGAGSYQEHDVIKRIDANQGIILPGLINTHTHIPMTFFRGLADDIALDKWLSEFIWPAEAKFLNANFVHKASLHGCAELVRNGITYFNDMYFWGDEIAQAVNKIGIKATIGEGIINQPIGNHKNPQAIIDYVLEMIKKYKSNANIDFSIAPHSIYTCSKDVLKLAAKAAKDNNLPIHIHLSETEEEVQNCLKQTGKLPVEYLDECGLLDNKVIAAHCTFLHEKELDLLEGKDFHVAVNTICNLKLASGISPMKLFIKHGINFAISTDGVASNNNLDLVEEVKTTSIVHKAINHDPKFLKAYQLLRSITIDAAKVMGKEDSIGSLEIGKLADIIILDTQRIENLPIYNPFSAIVYNMNGSNVNTVITNGNVIMKDRVLLTIDEEELIETSKNLAEQIGEQI